MRRIARLLIVASVLVALLPLVALADWQGPCGFKGLKWGTPLAECKGMERMDRDGPRTPLVLYQRKGEKPRLGDLAVNSIAYGFNSSIFTAAVVSYEPDYDKVKYVEDALTAKYGKPTREGMNYSMWDFGHGAVTIFHAVDAQKAELRYEINRFPDARSDIEIGPFGWGDF